VSPGDEVAANGALVGGAQSGDIPAGGRSCPNPGFV